MMRAIYEVARKEFLQHVRSTRLIVVGVLFLVSLIVVTIVLPIALGLPEAGSPAEDAPDGVGYIPSGENLALMIWLTIPLLGGTFFIQLLSIVMTSDAVCSEWHNRSIFLLLSKPVPRAAFVLGKFVGSVVPLMLVISLIIGVDYLVLQLLWEGGGGAEHVGRFFGAVGLILLGLLVFATMGLFFSTLTRSTLASLFMTFAVAFLVLPLIGLVGDFQLWADEADDREVDRDDARYDSWRYLNPGNLMSTATKIIGGDEFAFSLTFLVPTEAPAHAWGVVISGVAFTAVFLMAALLVVQVRNFE